MADDEAARRLLHEFGVLTALMRDILGELRKQTARCRTQSRWGDVPHDPGFGGRCTHCGDVCDGRDECRPTDGGAAGEHQPDARGECIRCGRKVEG
jgi:hypothetical protein